MLSALCCARLRRASARPASGIAAGRAVLRPVTFVALPGCAFLAFGLHLRGYDVRFPPSGHVVFVLGADFSALSP